MSFMEELLKVRSMMGLMASKVEKNDASIDIICVAAGLAMRLRVLLSMVTVWWVSSCMCGH